MRGLAPALMAFLVAFVSLAAAPAEAQAVFGAVTGPRAVAPGQTGTFNVTIIGGPSGDVNYTVSFFLRGEDLTGGTPGEDAPGVATGIEPTLQVSVTAPEKEQTVTLVVRITARSGSVSENTTVETTFVVLTPIVLRAAFRNAAPTAALNVTVRFFVDDALVGTRTIARIDPTAQASVTLDYVPLGLAPGAHRVRVEADIDGDGRIDPARGELVASTVFYREAASLGQGWSLVLGIVVFIGVFLVTVAARRRKQTG